MPPVTDWRTSTIYAGILSWCLSSWLLQVNTVGNSVVFSVAAVNNFLSVHKMMLFQMAKSCVTACFTQLWSIVICVLNISQGVVTTCLRVDGILNYLSLSVKGFWKLVSIWQSSGESIEARCIYNVSGKSATQFFRLTLPIYSKAIIQYPITPQMHHYTSLWNVCAQKCSCSRAAWSELPCKMQPFETVAKKYSSNDVNTNLLTNEKISTMVTPEYPKNHQLYATAATRKKDVTTKRLCTLSTVRQSLMASVYESRVVEKYGFDTCRSRSQDFEGCYCNVMLVQQLLPAMH